MFSDSKKFINQKACLINWNRETYNSSQEFIKSLTKNIVRPNEMFYYFLNSVLFILFSIHFLGSILMVL